MATSTTSFPRTTFRFDPANVRVACFVAASVLTHLVLTVAFPRYVAPEPRLPDSVDFAIFVEPEELEPIVEEPIEEVEEIEEPPPVIRHEEPVAVDEEEVDEEVDEVDEELQHEAETDETLETSEHAADSAESIAGTVSSTEGGLLVARHEGSGRDGGAVGRAPRTSPAPVEHVGIDRRRIVRDYLRTVQRALGAPQFTRALQRADVEGVVMVGLRIDPAGRVHAVRVKRSSGHDLIDDAALAHVQQVEQVPAPPDVLDWVTREITLPVRYVRR